MHMNDEQQWQSEEDQFAAAQAQDSAPPQEGQQTPPQEAPAAEPFEGFNALPETVRQRWAEADSQRKKYETDLAQARREVSALKGKVPYLERELAGYRKPKPAQAAPASASKPQQMNAEAWEAYKAQWPEEAKALEQYNARLAAEFGGKLDPLSQQQKELAERLERIEQRAHQAESESIQSELEELVPDWQVIAGWVNPDGSEGDGQWHPEFAAWLDSLPERVRGMHEESLNSRDSAGIAYVLNSFKRDYLLALQDEQAARPVAPAAHSRVAALRNVTPGAGANGLADRPNLTGYMSEEDRYAAAVSQYADRWQAQG